MAVEHIREWLLPAKVCGVSWGYTITSSVRGLRKLDPLSLHTGNTIKFVPLCGEPLGKPHGKAVTQLSSSSLAEQFDQLFNGGTEYSSTMSPVPAIIFHKDEKKVERTSDSL
jgi:DNA-binding transcriptional regulator LsrR (DeoR family)